jgi:uncharacterized repeat protein (TIGR02543 family)
MNYFDGWSDNLTGFHFNGLVRPDANGRFPGRMPLSGWRDNTPAAMRVALQWAHQDGVDFFFFDWFYHADPLLNVALGNYLQLKDHHGVGVALEYINIDPFVVPQSDWQSVVDQWVTRVFSNPDYARIDGEPILYVTDSVRFTDQWGGAAGVNAALATLRQIAIAHGLPGVFVIGSVQVGTPVDNPGWAAYATSLLQGENWDALTQDTYPSAVGEPDGNQPYSGEIAAGERSWDIYAQDFGPPSIPTVQAGWDPRPWNEAIDGHLWWFDRTPKQFGAFVADAAAWAHAHPLPGQPPAAPIVFVQSWNEFGEGMTVIPTVEDGYSYGQALAQAVGLPTPTPTKETLSITVGRGGAIKASPASASCSGRCRTTVDYGRQVILSASSRHGYTFQGWKSGCSGQSHSCSFIIEHDTTVDVTFGHSK